MATPRHHTPRRLLYAALLLWKCAAMVSGGPVGEGGSGGGGGTALGAAGEWQASTLERMRSHLHSAVDAFHEYFWFLHSAARDNQAQPADTPTLRLHAAASEELQPHSSEVTGEDLQAATTEPPAAAPEGDEPVHRMHLDKEAEDTAAYAAEDTAGHAAEEPIARNDLHEDSAVETETKTIAETTPASSEEIKARIEVDTGAEAGEEVLGDTQRKASSEASDLEARRTAVETPTDEAQGLVEEVLGTNVDNGTQNQLLQEIAKSLDEAQPHEEVEAHTAVTEPAVDGAVDGAVDAEVEHAFEIPKELKGGRAEVSEKLRHVLERLRTARGRGRGAGGAKDAKEIVVRIQLDSAEQDVEPHVEHSEAGDAEPQPRSNIADSDSENAVEPAASEQEEPQVRTSSEVKASETSEQDAATEETLQSRINLNSQEAANEGAAPAAQPTEDPLMIRIKMNPSEQEAATPATAAAAQQNDFLDAAPAKVDSELPQQDGGEVEGDSRRASEEVVAVEVEPEARAGPLAPATHPYDTLHIVGLKPEYSPVARIEIDGVGAAAAARDQRPLTADERRLVQQLVRMILEINKAGNTVTTRHHAAAPAVETPAAAVGAPFVWAAKPVDIERV